MINIVDKEQDIKKILEERYSNGWDYWATEDHRLLKGSPFTTLDSPIYLLELGMPNDCDILINVGDLILSKLQRDGRFKVYPKGSIYPCQTAYALRTLCYLNRQHDSRLDKTIAYFVQTQEEDGGWKCNKFSYGHGQETNYSTPFTSLIVLDCLRFFEFPEKKVMSEKAVEFLLQHWTIKTPISPCHYGIGTRFNQISYPFREYSIFYYVYVLSFYSPAKKDIRFLEAYHALLSKVHEQGVVVERVVPKLSKLSFCRKGEVSLIATNRFNQIHDNLNEPYL